MLIYAGIDLLRGLAVTLQLAALVLVIGVVCGTFCGVLYVWGGVVVRTMLLVLIFLARGIPLLVQIFAVFFILPLMGLRFSGFTSAAIALSIFATATITEIVRAGIEGVPSGQLQAAVSVGFRYWAAVHTIVLPQAFRSILPPLVTQLVFLIKSTSLLSLVGVSDLMYAGREVIERTLLGFEVMALLWITYTAICYPLTVLGRRLERSAQPGFSSRLSTVTNNA